MKKKEFCWGVGGNRNRIFISSSYGCRYNCSYCYLKEMGVFGVQNNYKFEELINEIRRREIFVPGEKGSLITIGCYTECMDDLCRETTMSLIHYFLAMGNYIQLSTKKKLLNSDILEIKEGMQYNNQMNIYISIPTLSFSDVYEPDIDPPSFRVQNIVICKQYDINVYLYIKPFIENITNIDAGSFLKLIEKYHIPVVVGERMRLFSGESKRPFLISNTQMEEYESRGYEDFISLLRTKALVYKHSDEPFTQMKKDRIME